MGRNDDQRARLVAQIYARMLGSKSILKANKNSIKSYYSYMQAKGLEIRTIEKNLYSMERFLKVMNPKVEFKKAKKDDIEAALVKLQMEKYSPETKRMVRTSVKAFYKHLLGEDYYYPRQVAWVKTGGNSSKKMLPEDLLSENEIIKMIESTDSPRNKAVLAVLYDTGIRAGELLSLRKKDIDLSTEPAHVTVNGKTGMRKIPIWFSAPYLARYLETVKGKRPDDQVWKAIGSWSNTNRDIDVGALAKLLKVAAKKAGIDKNIYPHLFRHSRASYYANKLTEQQLKAFFGWAGGSKQAATYVHLSGRDIDNAILKVYGKKEIEENTKPRLTVQTCARCRESNSILALHCSRCGAALEIATALKQEEMAEEVKPLAGQAIEKHEINDNVVGSIKKKRKK
jgi:site-specific recombinase XerD